MGDPNHVISDHHLFVSSLGAETDYRQGSAYLTL